MSHDSLLAETVIVNVSWEDRSDFSHKVTTSLPRNRIGGERAGLIN